MLLGFSYEMTARILILTNMGPKTSAPFQGQFVRHQVEALRKLRPVDYFFMRWHHDGVLNRLFKYPVLFLQFFWHFILNRQRYDLLHVHFYYPTIYLALAYKLLRNRKVKIVATCHGSDIYFYRPFSRLYQWCASWVDHWIYTSTQLQQKAFATAAPTTVLSAGINPLYAQAQCLSQSEKSLDVLYVGALDHNKGMDRLLQLVQLLPQTQFLVAGQGPYQDKLLQASQQLPNLTLEGGKSSEQLKVLYQQAKCFISLSRNESFGLVMTEAMACYTPVIATETDGGAAQLADRPQWLVSQQPEHHIAECFAEKIQQLLSLSASDYHQLQQVGRAQAEACLLDRIALEIEQIYQGLLASPRH